jgi:phosphomannomutase
VHAGKSRARYTAPAYIDHLLGYVDFGALRKLAGSAGSRWWSTPAMAAPGRFVDLLEPHLPFEFVKVHHEADGRFPNGVPNPMLEENRQSTIDAIRRSGADIGLAWDGRFRPLFLFRPQRAVYRGLLPCRPLAQSFLEKEPGARIVHDPRLTWNTLDIVRSGGGVPVLCKSGHAFIKQKMREVDGAYGGEMSAHHYFRDFAYCDSGMIPWLLVLERICRSGKSLAEPRRRTYPHVSVQR